VTVTSSETVREVDGHLINAGSDMKNPGIAILLFAVAMNLYSGCSKSVSPDNAGVRIEQMPGCKSGQLGKGSLATDSCFTYQFTNALDVFFCASANCCPDSNRFSIRNEIRGDTIFVTIADTAAHLCRCNCTYMLHAEFHDLPKDRYVFFCSREDYSSLAVLYSVTVQRH
jgi:hypothetical protein